MFLEKLCIIVSIEGVIKMSTDMSVDEKLRRLSFLKNQMMNAGYDNVADIEPTISQVLKDILGIGSEYTKKADKIYNGFIVPSSTKLMYGQATQKQYNTEKFEMYMKLLSQIEAYIAIDMPDRNSSILDNRSEHRVFLSYCWDDTARANEIDKYLNDKGITVTRDIRGVDNWQSLKDFMQTIRNNDFAVLLISEKYLQSTNCMYEVLEMMKEQKYRSRIFPAVIDTTIYSTEKQVEYVHYWENRVRTLKENLSSLEYTNGLALGYELKKAEDIARSIAAFLVDISDMKNPNIANVSEAIYEKLRSIQ